MSAKAIARSVKWLSGAADKDVLSESEALIYVGFKLGMTHPGTHTGLTPQKAFESRYKGQQSSLSEDFVADVLVYSSDEKHADHDDIIRHDFLPHIFVGIHSSPTISECDSNAFLCGVLTNDVFV